jgi:hypothetical protein
MQPPEQTEGERRHKLYGDDEKRVKRRLTCCKIASVACLLIILVILEAPFSRNQPSMIQKTRFKMATIKNHIAQRDDSLATTSPSGLEREWTTTPVRTPDTGKERPLCRSSRQGKGREGEDKGYRLASARGERARGNR